ncbi:hypothetical protein [Photobacterium sp. 1_MG-2023]|uniref:DUF6916 family protein n=1 Tax=Photobacterium sp. 1_MG-2023 TaxID=3062646 RepID=UPI0026E330B0|nr:hypothetical protein [Photobacterium sp. 1_MG-2023]MDO6704983.1 hypothetical protein [Photobacterium sp. 1_MG-2023]
MEQFTFERLEQCVGDALMIDVGEPQHCQVVISGVQRTGTHGKQWESYAFYLDCSAQEKPIEQGTYRFSHPQLGAASLFVSPNSEKELEVIISRKVTQP